MDRGVDSNSLTPVLAHLVKSLHGPGSLRQRHSRRRRRNRKDSIAVDEHAGRLPGLVPDLVSCRIGGGGNGSSKTAQFSLAPLGLYTLIHKIAVFLVQVAILPINGVERERG